jgi:Skp family chaperone for outer membrane proteins
MKHATTIVRSPAAILVVLLAAAVLGPSYAMWNAAIPVQPAIIASVDLERCFNEIERRAEAETALEALAESFRIELERKRDEADLLKQDVELYAPGTEKHDAATDAWTQAVLDYRATVEFTKAKLDARRAEARKEVYQRILVAAGSFAQQNGIDFIFADDSVIDVQQGTDIQIVQQMSLRRIVYANTAFDITDDLILWINQQ